MGGRLLDYIAQGMAADRPLAVDMPTRIAAGAASFYFSFDIGTAGVLSIFDADAIAWVDIDVGGGGVTRFQDLTDVDWVPPTDGQMFVWDIGSSKLVPVDVPSGIVDGDYGDIIVSSGGTLMGIAAASVGPTELEDTAVTPGTYITANITVDQQGRITSVESGGTVVSDGPVNGVGVVYSGTGLNFSLTAGSFYLNGTLYTAAAQTLALDAADPTNPRIDALVVDTSGVFGKVTGTPAATPEAPDVDAATQLVLTFITVPAAATDLSGEIATDIVYSDAAGWTATASDASIVVDSTNNPYSGTKCVEATGASFGDYVKFVRASPIPWGFTGSVIFAIDPKAGWSGTGSIRMFLYSGGSRVGYPVVLRRGTYGFDPTSLAYQILSIPRGAFGVGPSQNIDEIRFRVSGSSIGFYLDDISVQVPSSGNDIVAPISGISQAEGDARYLRQSSNLSDVASAATSRTNLDVYSKSEVDAEIASAVAGAGPWWGTTNRPTTAILSTKFKSTATTSQVTTSDDADVGMIFDSVDNGQGAGDNFKAACQATPSDAADWTATARITPNLGPFTNISCGICLLEATGSTGAWPLEVMWGPGTTSQQTLIARESLADSSYTSTRFARTLADANNPIWLRIRWVVASLKYFFDWSMDGKKWLTIGSQSKGDLLFTSRATHIGLGFWMNGASAQALSNAFSCDYWHVA